MINFLVEWRTQLLVPTLKMSMSEPKATMNNFAFDAAADGIKGKPSIELENLMFKR
mgnify:CR=1 FL=1